MSNPDYLLVTDVENSGTYDERDTLAVLLEVGVVLLDASTPDLPEVARGEAVIRPPGDRAHLDKVWAAMPPVVQTMHRDNGLWEEATSAPDMTMMAWEVDDAMTVWLAQQVPAGATVALAGAGVGHHDDRWLRAHLPHLRSALVYWNLDVSAIRRGLQLARRGGLVRQEQDVNAKPHRALADAVLHADELRYYLRLFGGLVLPVEAAGAVSGRVPEDMVE